MGKTPGSSHSCRPIRSGDGAGLITAARSGHRVEVPHQLALADLPEELGSFQTAHKRLIRWAPTARPATSTPRARCPGVRTQLHAPGVARPRRAVAPRASRAGSVNCPAASRRRLHRTCRCSARWLWRSGTASRSEGLDRASRFLSPRHCGGGSVHAAATTRSGGRTGDAPHGSVLPGGGGPGGVSFVREYVPPPGAALVPVDMAPGDVLFLQRQPPPRLAAPPHHRPLPALLHRRLHGPLHRTHRPLPRCADDDRRPWR